MGNPPLVFDLEKAKKNLSKLVPKQVQVTRNGRTFTQTVYVDPTTGQQPNQATNSPIDYQEFMRMAYAQNDKAAAMAYLEKQGVTWKKSPIDGVNWMRAAMAAKSAAGITSTAPAAPAGKKPTAATPAPPTAAGNAQSAQGGKVTGIDYQKLAAAGYDKADGKTKVALLKQTISRDQFLVMAKALTSWDASPHDGVNFMRASMAMSKWCAANDLDYLSQMVSGQHLDTATADVAANAAAPAPKAKKDRADTQAPTTPPAPVKPKDELEINPTKHTERQQNIIKFINSISDPKLLKGLAATGIVPEDADAQTFVLDRLGKEYDTHIRPSLNGTGGYSSSGYTSQADLKKQFAKRTTKVFKGVHQKIVGYAAVSIVKPEMLYDFVDPRSGVTLYAGGRSGYGQHTNFNKLVIDLNNKFGGYAGVTAPDDHTIYQVGWDRERALWNNTLIGKGAADPDTSSDLFDLEKEGIVRALRAVGDSDPKLKDKADEMVQTYSNIMDMVQHNPMALQTILEKPFEEIQKVAESRATQMKRAELLIDHLKTQYDMSNEDIKMTFNNNSWGKASKFKMYRANGDRMLDDNGDLMAIDVSVLVDPDTRKPLFDPDSRVINSWGGSSTGINADIANSVLESKGMPYELDYSVITPEVYDQVIELSSKLMGVKFQDHNTQAPIDPSIKPHEFTANMWYDVETLKDGDDPEKDAVLTNLSFILNVAEVNHDIAQNISDCPDSAANKQGMDYSGNFSYVKPDSVQYRTSGSAAQTMTPDEKSKILLEQLKKTPMFSLADLQQLTSYVQSNGDPSQSLGYGMAANEILSRIKSLSPQQQGFDGIKGTPIDEIFQRYTEAALQYCPQVYTARVQNDQKMREWARKTVGFIPYVDPNAAQADIDPAMGTQLYQLRSALFKAAHCTLRTADATEYADITHRVKMDFDYVDPATGKRVDKSKRVYDNRSLVLHGKVYIIANSEQEKKFRAEATRMGEQPVQMYHGTSYGGAAGIVGVDGQFRISGKNTQGLQTTGSMLGQGIYMAKLVGKTLPYMGNSKYSFQYHTIDKQPGPTAGFASDGCLLVCDALMGKHYHSDTSVWDAERHNDGTYDSVSVGAGAMMSGGTALKEYECIVRRNNQVMPKFIVDCGGRMRR